MNDKATIIETPEHNANEPETENQYSCDVCKKSFTDQEKLTNHMRIHKKGGKNHACDLCPMKFYYPNELMGHKSRDVYLSKVKESSYRFLTVQEGPCSNYNIFIF